MKKLVIGILVAVIFASCSTKKNQYVITGNIDNCDKLFITEKIDRDYLVIHNINLTNGQFTVKGSVDSPKLVYLGYEQNKPFMPFFLENIEIQITGNKDKTNEIKIEGSVSTDLYLSYLDDNQKLIDRQDKLYIRYHEIGVNGEETELRAIEKEYSELENQKKDIILDFVKENPDSPVSTFLLYRNIYKFDSDEINSAFNMLCKDAKTHAEYEPLQDFVTKLNNVAVGKKFSDFVMEDIEGNPVRLSDLVGNGYLLVDFWASWCGPCRVENPNVVNAYNLFKDKGFDILGVSLDESRDGWLKAIEEDKLTWHHVSDLAGWRNKASNLYAVRSIPANIIIDKDGVIIKRNIMGEELLDFLESVLE